MTVEETKRFLNRINSKEQEVHRKKIKRDALISCLLPSGIRYDTDRIQSASENRMDSIMAEVADIDAEISRLLQEQAMLIMETAHYIDMLEDETEKTVLYGFYIDRRRPDEVAEMIHYGRRRTYDFRKRGIEHLGEVLGKWR